MDLRPHGPAGERRAPDRPIGTFSCTYDQLGNRLTEPPAFAKQKSAALLGRLFRKPWIEGCMRRARYRVQS